MATLTVWKFDSPGGAPSMAARLDTLTHEGAITIVDGAVVEWAESAGKPRTKQLRHRGRRGALVGGGLGALVGTLLLAPVAGAAIGAAAGGAAASVGDHGIDADVVAKMRSEVVPGTSALFLLTEAADQNRLREVFMASKYVQLIHTDLPDEQAAELRAMFTKS
jgi:uncharacterized membrane protein